MISALTTASAVSRSSSGSWERPSSERDPSAIDTALCQDTAASGVLGLVVAGSGCGFSEVPMSGVWSVALDCRVVPECPPGACRFAPFVGEHARVDDVGRSPFKALIAIMVGIPPSGHDRQSDSPVGDRGLFGRDVLRFHDPPAIRPNADIRSAVASAVQQRPASSGCCADHEE